MSRPTEPTARIKCRDPRAGDYCIEVGARFGALADMVAAEDWGNAGQMFAVVERTVETHRQDNELRRGRA